MSSDGDIAARHVAIVLGVDLEIVHVLEVKDREVNLAVFLGFDVVKRGSARLVVIFVGHLTLLGEGVEFLARLFAHEGGQLLLGGGGGLGGVALPGLVVERWLLVAIAFSGFAKALGLFLEDVAFVRRMRGIVPVEEAILVAALGVGLSFLGVVLFVLLVVVAVSFLAVTGRLKILGSFHAFAEVNNFRERLNDRIKILFVHVANPVARDSIEYNVDEFITRQLLTSSAERSKVGELIVVNAADMIHVFASRHIVRLAAEAAHPALLLGQRLVRRHVDDDFAESVKDPVVLGSGWRNGVHCGLLLRGVFAGSDGGRSSGFLQAVVLSGELLHVPIVELLEGLSSQQLLDDGDFVQRVCDIQTVSNLADALIEFQSLAKAFATIEFHNGERVSRTVRVCRVSPEFELCKFQLVVLSDLFRFEWKWRNFPFLNAVFGERDLHGRVE